MDTDVNIGESQMLDLSTISYIVTHPGQAHRDDFLSVAIIQALCGPDRTPSVVRRDPTTSELLDPTVLVLDTGMRHEPHLHNFDHHQLGRNDAPACALSMLVEDLGLSEAFSLFDWWQPTVVLDSKGPFVLASTLGLPTFPWGLMSPIEDVMLRWFGETTESPTPLLQIMAEIGSRLILEAREGLSAYNFARKSVVVHDFDGVQVLEWKSAVDSKISALVQRREYPDAGVMIAPSDRFTESWVLYRYNDHPRVDFSRINSRSEVIFAHQGGFIAKLDECVPLGTARLLVEQSID